MDKFIEFIIFFSGTSIGGVLGYLLKTQIDHRLAIARSYETIRATEFNKAAATFRAAFAEAMFQLRQNARTGTVHPGHILKESVVVPHEIAKIMFEPFVPTADMERFNATWQKYRYGERNKGDENNNVDTRKELSQIYLSHIDNLLKFAEARTST